ncbi:MAG: outer-membrane lipoprotein carrier protein LolA [Candidatus Aureabacteria bacterium]|nr:outer-membrane lipoprotein carrier protein LolA [Candidatus Auribacterota bacterium]
MRYSSSTIIVLIGVFLFAANGMAAAKKPAPSIDRVILEMEKVREGIQDLTAVVEREIPGVAGRPASVAEIFVSYRNPDRLRTEVKGPDSRVVLINGDKMWVYSPGLEVVEIYALENEEARLRAIYQSSWGLTSPIKALVRGMNRTLTVLPDGSYRVDLVPDQKDAEIERIVAWVDPATWLITRMEIHQPGRPEIALAIKSWRSNQGVDDAVFDFRPPPGADVFEPLQKNGGSL